MSDDSFFREVDEELRSERVQNFWDKYKAFVIGGAIAIVVGTGGYRFYETYTANQAARAGDQFMEAVRRAENNDVDQALVDLGKIAEEGSPAYQALARMRLAAELGKQGKWQEAVEAYDAVAALSSADQNLRSIARLRAAALLVDEGTVTEVEARVAPLTGPGAPYRASAREYLALAYYRAGDLEQSAKIFNEIRADSGTPRTLSNRVTLMLELIASQGGPAFTEAPAQAAPAPATETTPTQ
ncbi:tetratricopeptide repeat protein [Pseudahrensia aquimaris]|uniref:Ancillary SecYEG translocon subunit n=1 Tax=Pseudahrensia aquimaris TaxID=744461 RepID=A0ABW3FEW9_9HYPH